MYLVRSVLLVFLDNIEASKARPTEKIAFLFLNQNICCGYSKEPSQLDCYFEHPKHMFYLIDKKIIAVLRPKL